MAQTKSVSGKNKADLARKVKHAVRFSIGIGATAIAAVFVILHFVEIATSTDLPLVDDVAPWLGAGIGGAGLYILGLDEAPFFFAAFSAIPLAFAVSPLPVWLRITGWVVFLAMCTLALVPLALSARKRKQDAERNDSSVS